MVESQSAKDIWIYHERQQALLCGQHALNNLVQSPVFDAGMLADIAMTLDAMERKVMDSSAAYAPSANVDPQGNFSIQVLKAALQNMFGLQLPHLSTIDKSIDITTLEGFVLHKSSHWFTIRKVGDRFWNLNSMLELPIAISHFRLATEMDAWMHNDGYTIFAIERGLPPAGAKPHSSVTTHGVYHCMEDLLKGRATPRDPWESLTGSGMKLQASPTNGNTCSQEEKDLQRALLLSVQETTIMPPVTPEPPADAPGCLRLQLKLPDGKRVVRRFLATDSVMQVYAVCHQLTGGDRSIDLKYGFPLKDMADLQSLTMNEANLAGESVQVRYL
ncbi:hypothetical protein MPSEU_000210200 [Mayamaea pseudoterrestris]|nr:hypothetical protein MPSEU_000210200 [Mayamaea pseudoterrestris]